MPEYQYECEACNQIYSEYMSISKFKKKKKCPNCGKLKLVYIYSGIYGSVKQEPKTVGQLADRNTQNMGKYEYESKLEKAIKANPSVDPVKRAQKEKMKKLSSATPENKQKYIETGILYG